MVQSFKRRCARLVSAVCLAALVASTAACAAPAKSPLERAAHGNNVFAVRIYLDQARLHPGKNVFLSPFSLSMAFGMVYGGSRGATAQQLASVFSFDSAASTADQGLGALSDALTARARRGRYALSVANGLWLANDLDLNAAFVGLIKKCFHGGLTRVSFSKVEAVCQQINGTVSRLTHNKIRDILTPGDLTPSTRLVLANAVYFKAAWAMGFSARRTEQQPFYTAATRSKPVALMHREDELAYCRAKGLQIVGIPYVNNDLSLVVLVPDQREGLKGLERSLTAAKLTEWMKRLSLREVKLWLPRFKLESGFRIEKQDARRLGVPLAWSDLADFEGVCREPIKIGLAVHKAFVEVNEVGTEATASTGIAVVRKGEVPAKPPEVPLVRADHPFMFAIRDNHTGTIIFVGRLLAP